MNVIKRVVPVCLSFILLLTAACGQAAPAAPPTAAPNQAAATTVQSTAVPPTATNIPPTATAMPPTAVPTVALQPGLGIPDSSGAWQISLVSVRTMDKTVMGSGTAESTFTPKEGYAFLVIDMIMRNLDPTRDVKINNENVAILDANKTIHTADGGGWGESSMCASCSLSITRDVGKTEYSVFALVKINDQFSMNFSSFSPDEPASFLFVVKQEEINQPWQLQFQGIAPIAFKVGDQVTYPVKTEVTPVDAALPPECQSGLQTALTKTGVVYQEWAESGVVTKIRLPDTDAPVELCKGLAYNELGFAPDGGLLLLTGPARGWASLYLVEPGGKVKSLVRNGEGIKAQFIPSTKYAVISLSQIGKEGKEIYLYDREKAELTQIYQGKYMNFTVFGNGNLLVEGNINEQGQWDSVMGAAGTSKLSPLSLPDGAYKESITPDGKYLVYTNYSDGKSKLLVANVDGSNQREVLKDIEVGYGDRSLSPDSSYMIMAESGAEKDTTHAALYDLSSGKALPIGDDGQSQKHYFSPDGKWAVVVTTFKRPEGDKTETEKQTLYLFSMDSKKVVKEVDGQIINSFFSPDGTHLAYTVMNEDKTLSMVLLKLADASEQKLGAGFLNGWSTGK